MNHLEDGSGLKNVWASSNFSCVKVKQLFFLRKISFLFLTFLWQVFDILILFANLHSGILCRGFSSPQRTRIYPSPLNVGIAIILKVHSGLKSQVFFCSKEQYELSEPTLISDGRTDKVFYRSRCALKDSGRHSAIM